MRADLHEHYGVDLDDFLSRGRLVALFELLRCLLERDDSVFCAAVLQDEQTALLQLKAEIGLAAGQDGEAEPDEQPRPLLMTRTESLLAQLLEVQMAKAGVEHEVPRPAEPKIVALRAEFEERTAAMRAEHLFETLTPHLAQPDNDV